MANDETTGTLAPGAIVGGRFKVDRVIGHGGMGEVYAAHHTTTSKAVALKVIRAGALATKDQTRRFMREARAATAIAHPNVIEVLDVFEDEDGTAVMVMELLKGETLSSFLKRRGALELHETAKLLVPALRGLEAAHARGVVHRDLKPDNIFLSETPAGIVTKVLDFGIAKVLDPARLGSETQGQATSTGSLLGTPHYMSHEQAMSDKNVDARTDVWSMGVIIFETLTGRRPLEYDTLGQMYKAFLQDAIPRAASYVPDLPSDVATALDHALAKEANERASSLKPLADALAQYENAELPGAKAGGKVVDVPSTTAALATDTKSSVSTSLSSSPKRASRGPWIVAGGVVIAVAAFIGVKNVGTHAEDAGATLIASALTNAATSSASAEPTRSADPAFPSASASQLAPAASQHGAIHRPPSDAAASPVTSAAPSAKHGIAERDPYSN